jgi:hypothetical protein
MAPRTVQRGLVSIFASLFLVCASGENIASSRAAVRDDLTILVHSSLLASSSTACFDVVTEDANITHIFVNACAATASEFAITVDGEPVTELHTDDGPCEHISTDVWFPLQGNQDTAHVCVSVQGDCPEGIQLYAKAESECAAGTMP